MDQVTLKSYKMIAFLEILKRVFLIFTFLLPVVFAISQSNSRRITGTVIDEKGEPLIGVNVLEFGTTNGTVTDINGTYRIQITSNNPSLKFTFVGFKEELIKLDKNNTVNVVLKEDVGQLEELVVIGYGTMLKKDFTGSVSQVDTKDMMKAPVLSYDQALAGRIAGVQISSSDGQPGEGMNIVIRGPSSLTQSNSPLYVIDGFPVDDPDNASINPEEIEHLSVLKDASATAIYGARAANGVIIIETKKGKVQKPVITLNSSVGFQQVLKKMEMMNPYEFVRYQMEVNETSTKRLYTTAELPETDAFYNPNGMTLESYRNQIGIDWQDLLFTESPVHIHNIAVRGGNADTRYSVSGSLTDNQGIIINTGSKRYQGRISINQNISKKVKGGITANYSFNNRYGQQVNEGGGNSFTSYVLYRAWAYRPVSGNPDVNLLEYDDDPDNTNTSDIRINPIISSNNEHRITNSISFLTNAFLDYDITKNLTLKIRGSISNNSLDNERFYNTRTPLGSKLNTANLRGVNGFYSHSERGSWSNENTITYRNKFNRIHTLTLLGGMSMQEYYGKLYSFSVMNLPNEDLGMYGFDEGTPYLADAYGSESSQMSFFGRVDYDYKSRYLLTATLRADGSSRFSPQNRWGYFPSAAFAWNMSNEDFMKNIPAISTSKIRVSYGHTGNNRIGEYQYLSTMGMNIAASYSFNNTTPILGTYVSGIGNENLKWETTEQFNVGYDFGILKNRVEFTLDFYNRITRDLLLNADMPITSGFPKAYKNIGSIQNQGFEFTVNTVNIQRKSFQWKSNFNISFNNNKILSLTNNQESMVSSMRIGSNISNLYISKVGYPAGMFLGYVFDGIYQVEDFDSPAPDVYVLKNNLPDNGNPRNVIQPGHIKYKDMNGDYTIDGNDVVIIGRGQPIHTGGFFNDLQYKRINLSFLFQWSYGNQIYNANRLIFDGNYINQYYVNQYASFNDRWTPENRSNKYFKVGGQGPAGYQSTRVLEDGSYLRLKTLSVGYKVSDKVTKMLKMTNISFNISAQNLFTFTKYTGMDPETSVRNTVLTPGYDYSAYPQARTITFGLNVAF